ncbi:SYF2 splicing factor-domain-containing protein [Phakopsora pachyrhizi]|uniref:Pre-mRNA-splicing factor SYF2 n=1 Tax=Phakopsora pachyrhizi TaxID=170000 RepID=A0AAV0AGU9_PHAPC|nr:SYF2 splicing factor-domain-containing protein [Phakopsora pachyrhizi]CAH7667564.1 SYF2 splicing factor-domain-containing protein [Phakopsora pachyrhizi]
MSSIEKSERGDSVPNAMKGRMDKLDELRARMGESAKANRKDVVAEANRSHATAKEIARLERKKAQAIALGLKAQAASDGEDLERKRAWQYSIEDNERWDKKMKQKKSRANFDFTDYEDMALRKYKKDVDCLKPDLVSYNKQRAAATPGGDPSTSLALSKSASSSTSVVQRAAAESLYRDMNSLVYADHKPSEEAIDRVVGKLNLDIDKRNKRSRVRKEEDGEITYINDKNKAFNKKIGRFYNKYTEEIRENIERGTAL